MKRNMYSYAEKGRQRVLKNLVYDIHSEELDELRKIINENESRPMQGRLFDLITKSFYLGVEAGYRIRKAEEQVR